MIVVRPLRDDERHMVFSDWIRSYRRGSVDVAGVDPARFHVGMDRRVRRLLASSIVNVAVHSDVPDSVLGWCCASGEVIHYVYVKSDARRHGIATELVMGTAPHARFHSHRTYTLRDIELGPLTFDPFGAEP